jgi:hypothetical protein
MSDAQTGQEDEIASRRVAFLTASDGAETELDGDEFFLSTETGLGLSTVDDRDANDVPKGPADD